MRALLTILICFMLISSPAHALFGPKDYKHQFLQNASNAERRKDDKSAFHLYEKTMYYYPNDEEVIRAYASFAERKNYYNKAIPLYEKLFLLTKNNQYLFRRNYCQIKEGKSSAQELQKLADNKLLSPGQQKDLKIELIYYFSTNNDWQRTKITCDKIPKNEISKKVITSCIVASERLSDTKSSYEYFLRYSQLYPKDVKVINKILSMAEKYNNYEIQEEYVKKLSALNPKDKGIKYRLAGLYRTHGDYDKALKVYEALMASGDRSQYVKESYNYTLIEAKNPNARFYHTHPKTALERKEDALYTSLRAKNFSKASSQIESILKMNPDDPEMLKLAADIQSAQKNYSEAVIYQEKLNKIQPSIENSKLLAFYYSQSENHEKALSIIDELVKSRPGNLNLLNLGYEYSMAGKNWDEALKYIETLLKYSPNSEKLLKSQGDIYSIKKDFPKAVEVYQNLAQQYPKPEYFFNLANLYLANRNFDLAEKILMPLYYSNENNPEITKSYINSLLAQNKPEEAYKIITDNKMEETFEGYKVYGSLAIKNKDYFTAQHYFQKAMKLEPDDLAIKKDLAISYRGLKKFMNAQYLYNQVLAEDPNDYDAVIGLGYVEIDKKNYAEAREYFNSVLYQKPDHQKAKMGIVHSYQANGDSMQALEALERVDVNDESKYAVSKTLYDMGSHPKALYAIPNNTGSAFLMYPYYDLGLYSEASNILSGMVSRTEDSQELEHDLAKDKAITITPSYSLLIQQLADTYDLDVNKMGLNVSQVTEGNKNVFLEYNMYIYSSGKFNSNQLNNVTNELRAGIQTRVSEKLEYRLDIGGKFFQFGGALANTDSWIKYFFNDNFALRFGFKRNNIEQSYLSAVGFALDGIFTGRVVENKSYVEYDWKLPKQYYSFGRVGYGALTGQNMLTNQYIEGMLGVGRTIYNNPDNKWIQTVNLDLVTYNSSYQYNLLNIYDSTGNVFGGYFSPEFFTANTVNLKVEGEVKKWRLKYGLRGFVGGQYAKRPSLAGPVWDVCPYIAYDINDYITINLLYNYFSFADIRRDQIMVNAVIKRF